MLDVKDEITWRKGSFYLQVRFPKNKSEFYSMKNDVGKVYFCKYCKESFHSIIIQKN